MKRVIWTLEIASTKHMWLLCPGDLFHLTQAALLRAWLHLRRLYKGAGAIKQMTHLQQPKERQRLATAK